MERLERHSLECEGLAPGVDDGWLLAHVAVSFCENREVFAERRIERGGGLYLRRDELSAVVFHKIDFHALGVPIEIEARPVAVVVCAFHRLKNDKILEKRTTERIAVQLFGIVDSRKRTGESRVVEIKFGRFYEPLASVLVPRRKEEADIRRVEYGKPFHYRLRGDAGVVGDGRYIENRADAPYEKAEKVCEEQSVLDFEKLMHVAFNVGTDVSVIEGISPCATRQQAWIAAGENCGKHIALWQKPVRLYKAEGKQCEYCAPSGKCLAYVLHEKKVAGASKDKEPVGAFLVHDALYVGKQIGCSLNFVENRAIGELCEECLGVASGIFVCTRVFKRSVGLVREKRLCKRRFARLPRADNGYDGKLRRRLLDRRRNLPFNVHGAYYTTFREMVQYGKSTSRIAPIASSERS